MTEITVCQGDWGYQLNFTLQDALGNVFDLTGVVEIYFKAQKPANTAFKFSGLMTPIVLTDGTCSYTVAQGNFNSVGIYNVEIQTAFPSEIVTFADIQVTVEPRIPF